VITTIRLTGMRTVHCVRAVRTALAAIDGIQAADVQVGMASLEHEAPLAPEALHDAIAPTGYVISDIGSVPRTLRVIPG
jgi:copper chaperone CopZ